MQATAEGQPALWSPNRKLPLRAGKAEIPTWNFLEGTSSTYEDRGSYLSLENILHKYMFILGNLEMQKKETGLPRDPCCRHFVWYPGDQDIKSVHKEKYYPGQFLRNVSHWEWTYHFSIYTTQPFSSGVGPDPCLVIEPQKKWLLLGGR